MDPQQYQYPMPMPAESAVPNILDYTQSTESLPTRGPAMDSTGDYDSDDDYNGAIDAKRHMSPECRRRRMLLTVALAVAVVLIIVILYYMFSHCGLAKGLIRNGWIVYYRHGCGYCTKQKSALGGKFHKYIECDPSGKQIGGYTAHPPLPCNSPAITGYPFWYNTHTKATRVGLQDAAALKKMAH
jgi:hypothetical protein